MFPPQDEAEYPPEEAQRRFEAITRAMLNMPPEPRKTVVKKGRTAERNADGKAMQRSTRTKRQEPHR